MLSGEVERKRLPGCHEWQLYFCKAGVSITPSHLSERYLELNGSTCSRPDLPTRWVGGWLGQVHNSAADGLLPLSNPTPPSHPIPPSLLLSLPSTDLAIPPLTPH